MHEFEEPRAPAGGQVSPHRRDLRTANAPARIGRYRSSHDGVYFHDLLPLPFRREAVDALVAKVERLQEGLGTAVLVEYLAGSLTVGPQEMTEWEFLREVCQRAGCALLLDLNNLYVTAHNLSIDPDRYLEGLDGCPVGEIHLGGHATKPMDGSVILIDDHARPVDPAVWSLYQAALRHFGPVPTLIEWDRNLPPLDGLISEANHAAGPARIAAIRGNDACE